MPPATDLRASRPNVRLDGVDRPDLAAGLLRLEIRDSVEGLARAELSVGNWGERQGAPSYLYFGTDTPLELGAALEVRSGDTSLFKGKVSALEGEYPAGSPALLTVLAEDGLQDLRLSRRSRSFTDMTDQDIFSAVLGEMGLRLSGSLEGPRHACVVQLNQSDLAFLRQRAALLGADLWLDEGVLSVQQRRTAEGAVPTLTLGNDLQSFRVVADLALQASAVTVSGWDSRACQATTFSAGADLLRAELGADQDSGPDLLARRLYARPVSVVHTLPASDIEARTEAEGRLRAIARGFVRGSGTTDRATVRVGRPVELAGLGPRFSGRYTVVETLVRFDGAAGLQIQFSVERPGLGRPK